MRIKKLILKNYRQFRNLEIKFDRDPNKKDLHIFIGKMGTGKTNLLNALNWCLYGDEPYLSKDSQQLPILNLQAISEAGYGNDIDVKVEIWAETENNRQIIFARDTKFRTYGQEDHPQKQETLFELKFSDDNGNFQIKNGSDAESDVERFVPKDIREFFFFDGERLDKYFREATGQKIRHAISLISQIEILEKVHNRVEELIKDFEKEAGKLNPKIEEIRTKYNEKIKNKKDIEDQIQELTNQIFISREKLNELDEALKNIPNVQELAERRENLLKGKKEKEERRNAKIEEKIDLLYKYGKIIMFWPAIRRSLEIVERKKKDGEIPPTIDSALLERIIKENYCVVCGRELDSEAKKKIENLYTEIRKTSEVARQLLNIENSLISYKSEISNFQNEIKSKTQEILGYETDLNKIEQEITKIDSDLSGFDIERVKKMHEDKKQHDEALQWDYETMGSLKAERQKLEEEVKEIQEDLNQAMAKEEKALKLKMYRDFCTKSLTVLENTKEKIMNDIRSSVESETKKMFFELIWKKESFRNVLIDDHFNIRLIHSMGYDCMGTISGGEREALTLSFTMALHKVSGFDSPIIIDRPLAMISGKPRENIANMLAQIGENKQVVLFFTPDDYSTDISGILDRSKSKKYQINLTQNEKEANMEELI